MVRPQKTLKEGLGSTYHPGMYANIRSRVRVNGQCTEQFNVGAGVHQGSVLNNLLFILVLDAFEGFLGAHLRR